MSVASAAVIPLLLTILQVFGQYGYPNFESEFAAWLQICAWLWFFLLVSIWITIWSSRLFSSLTHTIFIIGLSKGLAVLLVKIGPDYARAESSRLHTLEASGRSWSWSETFHFLLGEMWLVGITAILCIAADYLFVFLSRRRS